MIKFLIRYTLIIMVMVAVSCAVQNAFAAECGKHPIYCQILNNHPKINRAYAMKVSDHIHRLSIKHDIPSKIYTAILMQESAYSLEAKNCTTGFIKQLDGNFIYLGKNTGTVCSDLGIAQIYYKTAKGFNFDMNRLTSDLEYSLEAGAIVLADFKKRYSKKEGTWWTRYNARSKDKRFIYLSLVSRFM